MLNQRREFSFKIYPENMVVVQYNIYKFFTMYFSKINQTYFILYCNFINEINEWERFTLKFFEI